MFNGKIFLWIMGVFGGAAVLFAVAMTIISEVKNAMRLREARLENENEDADLTE